MMGMALRVVRSDGVLALYNGLSASLCRQVPQGPHLPGCTPPSEAPVGPDPRAHSWCPPGHPSYPLGAPQGHRSNFLLLFKAAGEEGAPRHRGLATLGGHRAWRCAVCCLPPSTGSVSPAVTAGLRRHSQMGKLRPGEGKERVLGSGLSQPQVCKLAQPLAGHVALGGLPVMSLWFPSDDRVPGCLGWGGPQGAGRAQHCSSTCTL